MTAQCAAEVKKVNKALGCVRRGGITKSKDKAVAVLHTQMIDPVLYMQLSFLFQLAQNWSCPEQRPSTGWEFQEWGDLKGRASVNQRVSLAHIGQSK